MESNRFPFFIYNMNIKTEGIKYAGSKLKLLPHILNLVKDLPIQSVLDGFSGTTRVSQMFAKMGYNTTSNDISEWSEVFANTYLHNNLNNKDYYLDVISHLNNLTPIHGWFSEYYGGTVGNSDKKPFQLHNTQKIDAIREEIDLLNLTPIDKSVILASLILAMDKVDNTLGHYVAYLKDYSARSYNDLKMELPMINNFKQQNYVKKGDIFNIGSKFDLVYLDPPYGSNNEKMPPSRVRYGAYYHIWKTIVLNDKPKLFGKANRREDSRDTVNPSVFEEFKKDDNGDFVSIKAIETLIKEIDAEYILLSYSSGGRATQQNLMDIIQSNGKLIQCCQIDYKKNVMSQMKWTNEWSSNDKLQEFLFLIKK